MSIQNSEVLVQVPANVLNQILVELKYLREKVEDIKAHQDAYEEMNGESFESVSEENHEQNIQMFARLEAKIDEKTEFLNGRIDAWGHASVNNVNLILAKIEAAKQENNEEIEELGSNIQDRDSIIYDSLFNSIERVRKTCGNHYCKYH